jgi:hypothetical protein
LLKRRTLHPGPEHLLVRADTDVAHGGRRGGDLSGDLNRPGPCW